MKWKVMILLQLEFIIVTEQSITGVTYRDDFDFEERYRDLHECDPFYYHPLHLPEHCAKMFEKLIRSRIAISANSPVRVVRKREKDIFENVYSLSPNYNGYLEAKFPYPNYLPPTEDMYDIDSEEHKYRIKFKSPFEKMFEFLRKDIRNNPTAPVVGMSHFGPVAMYEQPISKRSENLINVIAHAYARAGRRNHGGNNYEYYYGKIESPSDSISGDHKNNTFLFEQGTGKRNVITKKHKHKHAKRKSKKHKRTKALAIA